MKQSNYIYGINAVQTLIDHSPNDIEQLVIGQKKSGRIRELIEQAENSNIDISMVDPNVLQNLVGDVIHQGVVAKCKMPTVKGEKELISILESAKPPYLFLLLDQVQDPHNLGACLRSADACGVNAVIAPKDGSSPLSATVIKVSSGAALSVPYIQVTNLVRCMQLLQEYGVWLVGASGNATQTIYETELSGSLGIVMGSEGKGLRRLTESHCDYLVRLPMAGIVESLNVSVATGVCLFEVVRRMKAITK